MMICPGCYTKPPSGTMPTFSRIFSMARNWSTSINHISTHSTKLHQSTILNLNKNKLLMVGISTRATRGDEVLFTPRPPLSRPCACAYLSRCSHLQNLPLSVPRQVCLRILVQVLIVYYENMLCMYMDCDKYVPAHTRPDAHILNLK